MKKERISDLMSDLSLDVVLVSSPESVRYLTEIGPTYGKINYLAIIRDIENSILVTSPVDYPGAKTVWQTVSTFEESVSESENLRRAAGMLSEELKKHGRSTKVGIEKESVSTKAFELLNAELSSVAYVDVSSRLRNMRLRKTPLEVCKMRQAAKVGDELMSQMTSSLQEGKTELEIAGEGVRLGFVLGVERFLWTAAMIGARSALVGANPTKNMAKKGDHLLVDYGFLYGGYVCDMTRTVALQHVSERIRKMHKTATHALDECIKMIAPGVRVKELVDRCRRTMVASDFPPVPHDLGHGIGLEGHERPILNDKEDITLEPGMVIAIEPGIYIENLGGVRVEDEALVTEQGCEVLTRCSKDLILD